MKIFERWKMLMTMMGLCICLASCEEESDIEIGVVPYVEQKQTTYEIDAQAQDVKVVFTTNQEEVFFDGIWNEYLIIGETQSRPCDWITYVDTRAKVSDHTYIFHVEANESTLPRKAYMAVWFVEKYSERGILKFVHFVQAGNKIN